MINIKIQPFPTLSSFCLNLAFILVFSCPHTLPSHILESLGGVIEAYKWGSGNWFLFFLFSRRNPVATMDIVPLPAIQKQTRQGMGGYSKWPQWPGALGNATRELHVRLCAQQTTDIFPAGYMPLSRNDTNMKDDVSCSWGWTCTKSNRISGLLIVTWRMDLFGKAADVTMWSFPEEEVISWWMLTHRGTCSVLSS